MDSLGKYKIEAEIGRGAMGIVYRARDPQIDRLVAIKTIFLSGHEPEDQAAYRERFFQEARAAGRLAHPGIVTIFDIGQDPESGDPYIVMEYVAGQSLTKILAAEGGKLPVGPALQLAQEIAEALGYAHHHGVIHRDIKPGNILVTLDGHIKIADFGVARLNESEMTIPGQVLGSPAYMSPEQLRGDAVDARSDLFSLGVLLYRTLTGYRPFQGNSVHTVAFKVANYEPVLASSFEAGLPGEIDAILSRALAKDQEERYQSASEFADDLRRTREAKGILDQTASRITSVASPARAKAVARPPDASGLAPQFPRQAGQVSWNHPRSKKSRFPVWLSYTAPPVVVIAAVTAFWVDSTSKPPAEIQFHAQVSPPAVQAIASPKTAAELALPRHSAASRKNLPLKKAEGESAGTLLVEIDHSLHQGDASVWVDEKLVYDEALQAGNQALFFKKKALSKHQVPVSSGKHTVRVRVASLSDKYDASQTLAWTVFPGQLNVLTVHCDKTHNLLTTSLK